MGAARPPALIGIKSVVRATTLILRKAGGSQ